MVLLIFFFLLLCVALPLGEVSRITLGLTVSFTCLDVLVAVGSSVWLVTHIKTIKKSFLPHALSFWLVTFIFFVSLLVNILTLTQSQFVVSGLYILRFLFFGMIFFMVRDIPESLKKNIKLLLFIGGSLLLLSGYVQYFFYPSLRNLIYFGWDEHFYRMFGTFFDPNFFGLFLVLFFIFLLAEIFAIKPSVKKMWFSFLFLLASATCIGIFLTYSRTALVALIVGVFVLLWRKKLWKYTVAFLFLTLIVGTLFFVFSTQTKDVNSIFRSASTEARIGSARNALRIFIDHPIIGVGFNAYRYAQYRYHFMPGNPIQEDHGASGADSSLLLVLATSGIVGFIIFCIFLLGHFQVLKKQKNRLGLATFLAFFVGSFFVNGLFYPLLLVWVWVILGLTENASQ